MCGYRRKIVQTQTTSSPPLQLDVARLDARLAQISQFSASTAYEKQKSSLQKELENFLASLPERKDMQCASPRDLCLFLAWKDDKGKTQVHITGCTFLGQRGTFSCDCPTRLAFGTVDSVIGKLCALFRDLGRRGEWDPKLLVGNPARDLSLKNYRKVVKAEQLQAHTKPKQATPLFTEHLTALSNHIDNKLRSSDLTFLDRFIHMRDQAFFKTLMFGGDRGGDLGQIKTREIIRFPNNDGLLFNHIWGKTLRDGSSNLFGIRRNSNPDICPVKAIDDYYNFSNRIHINLNDGFLFRPTTPKGGIANKAFSSSAAESRLHLYLKESGLYKGHETLHGFRAGCAITLALTGSELQDIMTHVGWRSTSTAEYYIQLAKIMSASSASSRLSGNSPNDSQVGTAYDNLNALKGFSPAFP